MTQMVPLTLAVHDYDHVRDLASGAVGVEGVDADAACTIRSRRSSSASPAFANGTSRSCRSRSTARCAPPATTRWSRSPCSPRAPSATRRSSSAPTVPSIDPAALAGARIGVPEWTQTATVYARGVLAHEFGVALARRQLGPGRHQRAGPHGGRRGHAAARRVADADARGHAQRPAARRRDRRADRRPPADRFRARQRSDRAPVLRLPRGRGALLPPTPACSRSCTWSRCGRAPRAPSVDRDEPADRLRGGQAAQPRPARSTPTRRASRCPGARPTRSARRQLIGERLLALRHRAQPPTLESVPRADAVEQGVCARRLTAEELFVPEVQDRFTV